MGKKASDLVRESNERAGRVRKSVNLTPEQVEQLERLQKVHGTIINVFQAGMDALEKRNETNWPAELRRLANELDDKT